MQENVICLHRARGGAGPVTDIHSFSVATRETCRPGAQRVYVAERAEMYIVNFDDTDESTRWLRILHGLGLQGTCVEASSEDDMGESVAGSSEDDVDEDMDDDGDGSSDNENTDGEDAGRPEETVALRRQRWHL